MGPNGFLTYLRQSVFAEYWALNRSLWRWNLALGLYSYFAIFERGI